MHNQGNHFLRKAIRQIVVRRALIVSSHFPSDPNTYVFGAFRRQRMFIDALKDLAQLDVLFYVRPSISCSPVEVNEWQRILSQHWETDVHLSLCPGFAPAEPSRAWQSHLREMSSFFSQPGYIFTSGPQQVLAFNQCLTRNPDLVFAHRMTSMCPVLLSEKKLPPVFFDMDDVEHVAFARGINRDWPLHSQAVRLFKLPALLYGEQRASRLARQTFVCSEHDRLYLQKHWRLPRVEVIPNASDPGTFLPLSQERTLLFLGSFKYKPNVDAARFLIEQIWPRVRLATPEARLMVAGIFCETVDFFKSSFAWGRVFWVCQ